MLLYFLFVERCNGHVFPQSTVWRGVSAADCRQLSLSWTAILYDMVWRLHCSWKHWIVCASSKPKWGCCAIFSRAFSSPTTAVFVESICSSYSTVLAYSWLNEGVCRAGIWDCTALEGHLHLHCVSKLCLVFRCNLFSHQNDMGSTVQISVLCLKDLTGL